MELILLVLVALMVLGWLAVRVTRALWAAVMAPWKIAGAALAVVVFLGFLLFA